MINIPIMIVGGISFAGGWALGHVVEKRRMRKVNEALKEIVDTTEDLITYMEVSLKLMDHLKKEED